MGVCALNEYHNWYKRRLIISIFLGILFLECVFLGSNRKTVYEQQYFSLCCRETKRYVDCYKSDMEKLSILGIAVRVAQPSMRNCAGIINSQQRHKKMHAQSFIPMCHQVHRCIYKCKLINMLWRRVELRNNKCCQINANTAIFVISHDDTYPNIMRTAADLE